MCNAQVDALRRVGGALLGVSKAGSIFFLSAISPLERAVPARPATNPTAAKVAPLYKKVPSRAGIEYGPGSNMWLVGEEEKIPGKEAGIEDAVGAKRYISTKLSIDPTTRVEKTKSSSFKPKLGLDAMSPSTQAVTPTNSSIRTLKGNCGSAKTLDRHPSKNALIGSNGRLLLELESSSEGLDDPSSFPPPPPPVKRPPDPGGGISPPSEAKDGRSEEADVEMETGNDGLVREGVDRNERELERKAFGFELGFRLKRCGVEAERRRERRKAAAAMAL